jgi:hypothetical protein
MTYLTNTITYYYIEQLNIVFNSDEERNNFIKYCEYMMFSNYKEPYPIPEEDVKDNFRYLYKYIEMVYEEDVLEEYYNQKENEENKYYQEYDNYSYNEIYNEDLYSIYYFKS